MKKIALGLTSVVAFVMSAVGGCSSDEPAAGSPDNDSGVSETSTVDRKAPPPVQTDGGDAVCAPGDVASFKPIWKAPSGFNQKLCTPEQVKLLADCVWSHPGRDDAACKTFFNSSANKACVGCGYTSTSSAKLGAIVSNNTSVAVNYAGCVAQKLGDVTANGCGAKVQAAALCRDEACVDACPVPDDDTGKAFEAFLKCQDDAATSVCQSYADAAACADDALSDGGVAADCNPDTTDFGERAAIYVELFCGGLASDAGTDGGSDAATQTDASVDDAAVDASIDDAATTDAATPDADDAATATDAPADAPADGG